MGCNLRYLPILAGDPYTKSIEHFIAHEFPQLSSGKTENVMESIMTEFLGTKQVRIGPRPKPESEVLMRTVVRNAVDAGQPIPILMASAAVKVPIGESMDVAELSALRMLANLQERVKRHYAPGTNMVIRMEDLTEYAISATVPHIREHVGQYTSTMRNLVLALGYQSWLLPLEESAMMNEENFLQRVEYFAQCFKNYLDFTDGNETMPMEKVGDNARELKFAGWKNGVSKDMRDYLRSRYRKLYPETPESEHNGIMGTYLACILVRRQMNGMGMTGERLEIGFAAALPDTPLTNTRVYYRTVPLSQSSLHMPYWNAKGFFKINQQGEPRISLGPWQGNYTHGQLEVSNGTNTALLRADYTEED